MDSYSDAWRDFRWRRWLARAAFVGWLILLWLAFDHFPTPGSWLTAVLLTGLFVTAAAGFYVSWWPCPRCKEPFFLGKWLYFRHFASTCVHCGLPIWAETGDQAGPPNQTSRSS
jgi:hypothetical protein